MPVGLQPAGLGLSHQALPSPGPSASSWRLRLPLSPGPSHRFHRLRVCAALPEDWTEGRCPVPQWRLLGRGAVLTAPLRSSHLGDRRRPRGSPPQNSHTLLCCPLPQGFILETPLRQCCPLAAHCAFSSLTHTPHLGHGLSPALPAWSWWLHKGHCCSSSFLESCLLRGRETEKRVRERQRAPPPGALGPEGDGAGRAALQTQPGGPCGRGPG